MIFKKMNDCFLQNITLNKRNYQRIERPNSWNKTTWNENKITQIHILDSLFDTFDTVTFFYFSLLYKIRGSFYNLARDNKQWSPCFCNISNIFDTIYGTYKNTSIL